MSPIKPDNSADELTDKQRRFVQEYPVDSNAKGAAIRAGYSSDSAADIGYELKQNPRIQAALAERFAALGLAADEAVFRLSNIATTRLNDFFDIKEVQGYEQREEYVTVLITRAKEEIKHIEAFIGRHRLKNEARESFDEKIVALHAKIMEWELEVERYGDDVTRLAPGRPIVQYVAELNMVKLAQAKAEGLIKSYSVTKDGVKVDTYAADSALREILKLQGRYIKKVEIKDLTDPLAKLTDEELLNEIRKLTPSQ